MKIAVGVLLAASMAAATMGALAQSGSSPSAVKTLPCADARYRQFDFWIGKWDVRANGKPAIVAHSLIEKLYGGCAIRENWMPLARTGGGSLSGYDGATGKWRQAWIDSSGTRVDFTGGYDGDQMVITGLWRGIGGPGKDGLVRMSYSRQPGGGVRQLGEVSFDDGKSWAPSFDFIYSPSR